MKKIIALFVVCLSGLMFAGCASTTSDADVASENLSKAAEQFEVQRRIVGVNGITDKVEFVVEGRCSIERSALDLEVTCKEGPRQFKKHFVGLSDNMFFIATQLQSVNVSVYRTRIILKPEGILPDFDLVTGERG